MPRRFLALFFALFLSLTALFAGVVYVVDPFYHFHGPMAGLPLCLRNPRYQTPGAAEHLSYDHLLLGTSVTANFYTNQFDQALGGRTQKIIIHGAYFGELLRPLDIALETHEVDQVFWGVDSDCWQKYDKDNTWVEPTYLFDENPFNDVRYLLNKDMFFWDLTETWKLGRQYGDRDETTGSYTWGEDKVWSREEALANYPRPDQAAEELPADALLAPVEENLSQVLARVDANPQVTFTFYLPPGSILFWDKIQRSGALEATLTMQQQVMETLISRPNVRLFYFMDDLDLITNLDNYGDHVHYAPEVCQELARRLLEEEPMTAQEIAPRMAAFRAFLEDYPYDTLFAGES